MYIGYTNPRDKSSGILTKVIIKSASGRFSLSTQDSIFGQTGLDSHKTKGSIFYISDKIRKI